MEHDKEHRKKNNFRMDNSSESLIILRVRHREKNAGEKREGKPETFTVGNRLEWSSYAS